MEKLVIKIGSFYKGVDNEVIEVTNIYAEFPVFWIHWKDLKTGETDMHNLEEFLGWVVEEVVL